ncbi:MAG: hypothetical protein ACTSWN_00875 [Promethearchaeota archaeon]
MKIQQKCTHGSILSFIKQCIQTLIAKKIQGYRFKSIFSVEKKIYKIINHKLLIKQLKVLLINDTKGKIGVS